MVCKELRTFAVLVSSCALNSGHLSIFERLFISLYETLSRVRSATRTKDRVFTFPMILNVVVDDEVELSSSVKP